MQRGVCGYLPLLDVVKYFDFKGDIVLRQLWWLKGSSIKSLRKEDNLARDFDRSYDMHMRIEWCHPCVNRMNTCVTHGHSA